MHPVIVSRIVNPKYQQLPLRSLEQILDSKDRKQTYRSRFSVQAVQPSNPSQMVRIYNPKTNESREAKGALKKDEKYMLYMQLYVQDYSNFLSNQVVRVLVDGGFMPGLKPEEVVKGKKDVAGEVLKNLAKFNVWVEGAIEVNENGYLVLKDTQLN